MLNSVQVAEIIAKESILVGNMDVVPLKRAMRLFGADAVEFVTKLHDGRLCNAYGIGDCYISYLTPMGIQRAVTYNNIKEIQKIEGLELEDMGLHTKESRIINFSDWRKKA